jgi:hypothetical protein
MSPINISSAKGAPRLFPSARWKAYLQDLRDNDTEDDGPQKAILHIYHSQDIWFTQEKSNGHGKAAEEHLKQSDALLKDCATKIDALEETLANTPKPSEALNWDTISLQDLL